MTPLQLVDFRRKQQLAASIRAAAAVVALFVWAHPFFGSSVEGDELGAMFFLGVECLCETVLKVPVE
jgi:hypothetical protein